MTEWLSTVVIYILACGFFLHLQKYHSNFCLSSCNCLCPCLLLSSVELLCNPMNCSTTGLPVHHRSQSSHKLTCIESVMTSRHLIICRPLLLLPPIPPSIRVVSNESSLHMRWPKYWSFSFSISPSKEHPGWSPLAWTGWISLQSKGLQESSQESSPQFKSVNSSVLNFLHNPTLTSIHDHWKNHSLK